MCVSRRKRYYGYKEIDFDSLVCFIIVCLAITILKMVYDFVTINYRLIILVLFALLSLGIFIYVVVNRKKISKWLVEKKDVRIINKLKKQSLLYSNIEKLNNEYDFEPLKPLYDSYNVYRKSDLSNLNIDDYLLMTINNRYSDLTEYCKKSYSLYTQYKEYETKYEQLKEYINDEEAIKLKIKNDKYVECQNRLLRDYKMVNPNNFAIVIYVNYSSKKGRVKDKRYRKYNYFEYKDILKEYNSLKETKMLWQISSRVERAKMSESLRYDILKRDNFRCKICGATERDGVKLHVDHIIPVSKGGKTEPSNLQTLCSRCNIGKGNKMD